jgi:hypothetical protein
VATPAPDRATAPAPRSAALTSPNDETQDRAKEPRVTAAQPAHAPSHLGKVGPSTWPSAFEDVIGFALWPKDYGERLRSHGIGDVIGSIFKPGDSTARTITVRAGDPKASANACADKQIANDWPSAEIERTIELNKSQRTALDDFKRVLAQAVKSIKATCRDDASLGAPERLRAMQTTLWAVHDAALLIRTPLANFYDSLSDDQRRHFASPTQNSRPAHNMSRADMASMCGMPTSGGMPVRQLEQSLHTNKAQQASLEALQKK